MRTGPQEAPRSYDVSDADADLKGPGRRPPVTWLCFAALSSALVALGGGVLSGVLYPVLSELQGERVRANDGLLVAVLGFWSILVLSVLGGFTCSALSCSLTYVDAYTPGGGGFLTHIRHAPGRYAVALMNGCMATVAVAWTLS